MSKPQKHHIKSPHLRWQRLITAWALFAVNSLNFLAPLSALGATSWLGKQSEWVAANLEKNLSIEEIAASTTETVPWKQGTKDILAFGMKATRFWVRTQLHNPQATAQELFVELEGGYFEIIDMYILSAKGDVESAVNGGSRRAQVSYMLNSPYPVIKAHLEPGEKKTMLLHVKHYGTINLPLRSYPSVDEFTTNVLQRITINSMFYASQFIIITLNLIFFIATKNFIFLLFGLSQIFHRCLSLAGLDGFFQKFIGSDLIWINSRAFLVFSTIGLILTIEFSKVILRPALKRDYIIVLNFFILCNFINLLVSIFYPSRYNLMVHIIMEIVHMSYATYYSYKAYRKSLNVGKYLMINFPIMNLFTILYALRFTGLFPINAFSNNSVQIASTLELLLVGATLADKLNHIGIDYMRQRAIASEISQRHLLREAILNNLTKQVKMASQLSDKLNSPLLVLFNIYETLERKWNTTADKFHASWPHLNTNMHASLSELKDVSTQLEHMRESENKALESTKLLTDVDIDKNEHNDAAL